MDRKDLFKIAYEADRCLCNGGFLVIKDFSPPFPYKNRYIHLDGILTYKMDYSKMFDWNPAYNEMFNIVSTHSGFSERENPNERVSVKILQKNINSEYPLEPFGNKV